MTLKRFVKKYVGCNTLIRIWIQNEDFHGYTAMEEDGIDYCMNWQFLEHLVPLSKYGNYKFRYVKDIYNDPYPDCVNLVVSKPKTFNFPKLHFLKRKENHEN